MFEVKEVLKKRIKTRFIWFDPEDPDSLMQGQEEEVYEPVEQNPAPEFMGVVETAMLPHGQVPPWGSDERTVFKVYEKVAVWLRRIPVSKEVSS